MDYKKELITFFLKKKALTFGNFTLNSGRTSPYFFNSGVFSKGKDILKIGLFYAHCIMQSKKEFNLLFGSAYKGIPIVIATSIALNIYYNINIPYVFNRKEKKKHGEKGILIGENIKNKKIVILDDVVTSGISANEACKTIEEKNGKISAVFVLLDRQEKKKQEYHLKENHSKKYIIHSIINMNDLINYLASDKKLNKHAPALYRYQNKHGI